MFKFLRSRAQSFRFAFEGLWHVIRTQKNAWIHAVISILVILIGFWFQISPQDWGMIILTIGMVWAAEFFNTALEAIIDLISPEKNHLAKVSKDVGAAAVLIAAGVSVIIGLLILGPPLWRKLELFFR